MYAPSNEWKRSAVGLAAARRRGRAGRASRTPFHCTSGTRHPVTHWKSRVSVGGGHRDELVVGELERLVDETADPQRVVGAAARRAGRR